MCIKPGAVHSGAQLSCLVNPRTGHETELASTPDPHGERICVLGAGPAGLSYASLVADDNDVTVLEQRAEPGGAFRYTGKAPRFNDVDAAEPAFAAYVTELERACRQHGVRFCYRVDTADIQQNLAGADRVVIATGAAYRFGLGRIVPALLESGLLRSAPGRRLFRSARFRDWLYYRARIPTGHRVARQLGLAPDAITVIGDAASAGKAVQAISQAFHAALQPVEPTAANSYTTTLSSADPREQT
ncbi:MAG: NAD(P)-binding protein [Sciscionella sp.]